MPLILVVLGEARKIIIIIVIISFEVDLVKYRSHRTACLQHVTS